MQLMSVGGGRSSLMGKAFSTSVVPGWTEEHTPTPFLYDKLTSNFLMNRCSRGVSSLKL